METMLKSSKEFDALVKSIKLSDDVSARSVVRNFDITIDELLEKFCNLWKVANSKADSGSS